MEQDFLVELMQHHRTRKSDLYDSAGENLRFYVGKAACSPALFIRGNKDPISWCHAVDVVFAKDVKKLEKKDNVKYSIGCMRYEVRFGEGCTLKKFLRGRNGQRCSLCDKETSPQADHHPLRFEDIVYGFLEERKLSYEGLGRLLKKKADFGTGAKFRDRAFAKDWIIYHDARAQYRWLCKTCNIKGNTGVKKRKRR